MIKLDVWLTMPSGKNVRAGTLVVADPDPVRGGLDGQFRYASKYLVNPQAFPLDPLHLPLSREIFNAARPYAGVHGVFEDSLPDDWGRKLMIRHYNLARSEQRVPQLLQLLGNQGLGALSYAEEGHPQLKTTGVSYRHLQDLVQSAEKFERDPATVTGDEFSLLFQAGSSPGGARPKALVEDEQGPHLVKFSSFKDKFDVVSLEAATMELSRRSGVETAESRVIALGSGKCLLVKRFDINGKGGRNHLISMQSLLKADGYYHIAYRELAEVIKHISAQPGQDLLRLYRQMVFNVMIGNTDDHLKNFLMLRDDKGWRLSPAFDLLPDIGSNREHILRIGPDNRVPTIEILLAEAGYFGIKRRRQAMGIIGEVYETISGWRSVFAEYGVPRADALIIGADINQRLGVRSREPLGGEIDSV